MSTQERDLRKLGLNDLLDGLTEDVRPFVKHIEGSLATTQGHYGDYMDAISRLSTGQPKNVALAVGVALIRAGANAYGVASALRALGHI